MSPESTSPRPVSIWEPTRLDGKLAFVRPDPGPFGDHYAARKQFFADKRSPTLKRVCFFGESAAAGYLYAPHLTPAGLLEKQLLHVGGAGAYEVIDLAKTNESLDGLVAKVEAALQLEPDLIVIYTGNNWCMLETPEVSPYAPDAKAQIRYAEALKKSGLMGVIELAARKVLQKAATAFSTISLLCASASIPLILVIPEVNHVDWENRQPVAWLEGDQMAKWYEFYDQAMGQLSISDWEAAMSTALAMSELDKGSCPTAYRILAKAYLGMGLQEKAGKAFQAEVDSNHYANLCFLGAPQAGSMAKELQKRIAAQHGFHYVFLPDIFREYCRNQLPGRQMFLDYCHLTLEGMQVAMAAVSAEIIHLFSPSEQKISPESLIEGLPGPLVSPEADATAKFGAAIHTAHRLLTTDGNTEILEYWCREALKASPGIRQSMLDFVAARLSGIPAVLTAAQQRNIHSSYRLMMQHGWKYDYMDLPLILTIWKVLGIDEEFQHKTVREHHQIAEGGMDLIHPPSQLWEPVARFFPEVMEYKDLTHRAYYRAAWPVSDFGFVAGPAKNIRLKIVSRLPAIEGCEEERTGDLTVGVNGHIVGRMCLHEKWTGYEIIIDSSVLSLTLNRLSLHWPRLPACGDKAMEAAIKRMERGIEADIHPVFGEVFSLYLNG